ncbi:MAG: methanogenesis marker protein Mmp4/MtxX [Candidatus Hodarchaeota archaeon]
MSILNIFKSKTKGKTAKIGIGLGTSQLHNNKVFNATTQFLAENASKIYLYGTKDSIEQIRNTELYNEYESRISLIGTDKPEKEMVESIRSKKLNGIIRGAQDSHQFLNIVKKILDVKEINRLALLETSNGIQFFFGPVGIDECNSLEKKINYIRKAINEFTNLKIEPKISILSGGRKSDYGRDKIVDKTIDIANKVVKFIQEEYPKIKISHDEILIENAIEKGSNLVIAPDGISGNLIYRTLVHLGGGKAYGAIYMGLNNTIIDTSRVGNISEIQGALILAIALSK